MKGDVGETQSACSTFKWWKTHTYLYLYTSANANNDVDENVCVFFVLLLLLILLLIHSICVVPLKLADWFVVRIKKQNEFTRWILRRWWSGCSIQFIWNVRAAHQMKSKWYKNKLIDYVYLCDHICVYLYCIELAVGTWRTNKNKIVK